LTELQWTDSQVGFVELVISLHDAGSINNGNISIKKLFSVLGDTFNFHVKDYYRYFTDITHRKADDDNRTFYLNKLKCALNKHISKSDLR